MNPKVGSASYIVFSISALRIPLLFLQLLIFVSRGPLLLDLIINAEKPSMAAEIIHAGDPDREAILTYCTM